MHCLRPFASHNTYTFSVRIRLLSFTFPRGAFGKVTQLLQNHKSFLSIHDLPSVATAGPSSVASTANDSFSSDCVRSRSSSICDDGSDNDDLSTLNPIPENQTLGNVNRWGNGGSSHNTQGGGELSSPPPQPARRMREMSDVPPAAVKRQVTITASNNNSSNNDRHN